MDQKPNTSEAVDSADKTEQVSEAPATESTKTDSKKAERKGSGRSYVVNVPAQDGVKAHVKRFKTSQEAQDYQASLSADKKGS